MTQSVHSLFSLRKNAQLYRHVSEIAQHRETEGRIVALLHQKNKEAIRLIYQHYAAVLLGTIKRIVKDAQLAEDVFQDAMVKIWKNGPNYQTDKGRLFTWMISICRNQAIDTVRTKAYKVQQSSAGEEAIAAGGEADSGYHFNPDQIGVREKLEKLPAEYQEVIEIVYYRGYTHKEAAEALQLPLGTVKSRIRIAIRELRSIFGES